MNMISAERLLGKNETGAPRAFMKESMELRAPLRIIKLLSIRSMATSQERSKPRRPRFNLSNKGEHDAQ